jgi:hypothetical protein
MPEQGTADCRPFHGDLLTFTLLCSPIPVLRQSGGQNGREGQKARFEAGRLGPEGHLTVG